MAIAVPWKFGPKLCDVLGIDPKRVKSIDLHVGAEDGVEATVRMVVRDTGDLSLGRYRLVPLDEADASEAWEQLRANIEHEAAIALSRVSEGFDRIEQHLRVRHGPLPPPRLGPEFRPW